MDRVAYGNIGKLQRIYHIQVGTFESCPDGVTVSLIIPDGKACLQIKKFDIQISPRINNLPTYFCRAFSGRIPGTVQPLCMVPAKFFHKH
jgi:hypothetical protein